jgi:methionyl-tRNA synthetase
MSNKKFYITTSIAYTNAPPHIGFALESIQADVLARYHRLLGEEVFFLTGTDEHGTKIAWAAKKEGKRPQEFVDEISAQFKSLGEILNLSNSDFIRTTDQKRHWPTVNKVWLKLKENGDIYKKKYKGLYCVGCEAFIKEKDLIDGKCPNHQKEPEIIEEENYFFKLSKYQKPIEEAIKKDEIKIIPETRKNEMLSFLKQGLEDISFSRPRESLQWGIPVPDDESQTVYVWCDALSNYISALNYAENGERFQKFWPADIHLIGKDIQKFHCLIWPGMLLSLGIPLPKKILVHGFITADGQKMSKSLGNIINPLELVEKYGTDAVRYFLLREIPSAEDGDFTYEKFEKRYNSDLAAGIGNLVARTVTLAEKLGIGQIKPPQTSAKSFVITPKEKYNYAFNAFRFNDALSAIWEIIGTFDRYIDKEEPWKGGEKAVQAVSDSFFALGEIAKLLHPFLPQTSEKILKQLETKKPEILFPVKK